MDLASIIQTVKKVRGNSRAGLEDIADKFNCVYTVALLILLSSIVTVKQYFLKSLSCFVSSAQSGLNMLDFMENLCWVEGTIPIAAHESIPTSVEEWQAKKRITYYQWVPIVLSVQCLAFYLPRVLSRWMWRQHVNLDIQRIIQLATRKEKATGEIVQAMQVIIIIIIIIKCIL